MHNVKVTFLRTSKEVDKKDKKCYEYSEKNFSLNYVKIYNK